MCEQMGSACGQWQLLAHGLEFSLQRIKTHTTHLLWRSPTLLPAVLPSLGEEAEAALMSPVLLLRPRRWLRLSATGAAAEVAAAKGAPSVGMGPSAGESAGVGE